MGMVFDPDIHHRKSIRLRTHDYAAGGMYYVTICAEERRRLFGVVVNGRMALNEAGRMVTKWFAELENKFPDVRCDAFVCMPDHVHFVVRTGCESDGNGAMRTDAGMDVGMVGTNVGANLCVRPPVNTEPPWRGNHLCEHIGSPGTQEGEHAGSPLRNIVAWFKTMTTNEYIRGVKHHGWPPFPGKLWQRNYYEHIVRNDADLTRIRAYIRDNPANWDVLRYGEPRFMIGNRALLDLPKTAYFASRGGDGEGRTRRGGPVCPPSPAFPTRTACVISGFLSPMERAVFAACLADGTPMIQVLARGLPKTFPPRVRRALDAGRLLVISPFTEDVNRVNAVRAAWCNQYLLHTAEAVVIGYLNPDGMLACLLADMPDNKPVEVLAVAEPPFVV